MLCYCRTHCFWSFYTMRRLRILKVIQQIFGPNFTLFWPPSLSKTIVSILHTTYKCATYPLFTWPSIYFLVTTYLPFLIHVVIEWPMVVKGFSLKTLLLISHSRERKSHWAESLTNVNSSKTERPKVMRVGSDTICNPFILKIIRNMLKTYK
jgi:hypothetical protein